MSMVTEKGFDFTKHFKTEVNQAVTEWADFIDRVYPERRSCIPVIIAISIQMFAEVDKFQLTMGKSMPEEILSSKFAELIRYSQFCIRTKDELPTNIDKAIEELDKKIILQTTQFQLKNEVTNWNRRFSEASAKKSSGCAAVVQGKAREIMLNLEQMKDVPPNDLTRVSELGSKYLENYANRCLHNGPKTLPLELPEVLQSKSSQNSPPPTRRPNPATEMPD